MAGGVTNDRGVFVHPQALCESTSVGSGTRVWAFAHVLPGAIIGADCNVCDHVFIENDVRIGDRVTIKSGVQLWNGLRVADDAFIGPNATFSNDKFPRSKQYQAEVPETHVGRGASIGSGAVILPGVRIGALAMIGAGAVVTRDVPPKAIVSGNPARIVGYADTPAITRAARSGSTTATAPVQTTSVRGVTVHRLTVAEDLRGRLVAGEFGPEIPFEPKRYFLVFDVPGKEVRGEHAHRKCQQFLVCIRGSVSVVVDDGTASEEIELSEPGVGVLVPPMVWAVQYKYSADAMLLVFASEHYDASDYIRDYEEFRNSSTDRTT
jgi:acetyltransferase-like isoleucine patch superfamily enzyme/dTDP-4-dehydrorhamnose 3,5-epimerase-like enzyme